MDKLKESYPVKSELKPERILEVFKVPAELTDGPNVLNAGDAEYVWSTIAIPSSRGMVEGLRGLDKHFFKKDHSFY